jgi:hypothetical protein
MVDAAALAARVEELERAIRRHRRQTECCTACSDANIADARRKQTSTPDARLWALVAPHPASCPGSAEPS